MARGWGSAATVSHLSNLSNMQQRLILMPRTVHVFPSVHGRTPWAWRLQSPRGHRNHTLEHSLSFNATSTEWAQWLHQGNKRKTQRWQLPIFGKNKMHCFRKCYWLCHICLMNLNHRSQEKRRMCHLPFYGVLLLWFTSTDIFFLLQQKVVSELHLGKMCSRHDWL